MSKFRNVSDPRFADWVTASGGNDGCVFVSRAVDGSGDVAIAESEAGPNGPITVVSDRSWRVFLAGARDGVFDTI